MGVFWFGSSRQVWVIDDRLLRHLQVVILEKLREGERFAFSYDDEDRFSTVWITPQVSIRFDYLEPADTDINPDWVRQLADTADTPDGLRVVPEPHRVH